MKTRSLILLCLLAFLGCKEDENPGFIMDLIQSNRYYNQEVIPVAYQNMYGQWRLYDISGGLTASGKETDFDYLELKPFGIYGMVRDDILFEYGSVEKYTFDSTSTEGLQVRMLAEFPSGLEPYFFSSWTKYVFLRGTDSLDLVSPCCDMYNYHFVRASEGNSLSTLCVGTE